MKFLRRQRISKNSFKPDVSIRQVERAFATIRASPTWKNINNKLLVYPCVKQILQRFALNPKADVDLFDFAAEFTALNEYEFAEDFLDSLERQHKIPKAASFERILDAAELELQEKAEYLGKAVITKNELEYYKRCVAHVKQFHVYSEGWAASLL